MRWQPASHTNRTWRAGCDASWDIRPAIYYECTWEAEHPGSGSHIQVYGVQKNQPYGYAHSLPISSAALRTLIALANQHPNGLTGDALRGALVEGAQRAFWIAAAGILTSLLAVFALRRARDGHR